MGPTSAHPPSPQEALRNMVDPNPADALFNSQREVPMPPNIKEFTQEHWDILVQSLTDFVD
jgi:hypothetical protein